MDFKIGAAYVRVSTADQLDYSPESQLKLIQDYAKREGYIIPEEYIFQDGGISGKSADKRPAFRLMIATAKEEPPPFTAIFVWKYSRFARNQEEAIMYKNLLRKRGVDVRSISEPSSDSPYASLIERIIEWMDEFYLINLAGEVRRGMKEKASRGEAMGRPPFGYKVENKILVPDENAAAVKYIYEAYISGKNFREIAADLSERGVKLQNGYPMNREAVQYVLQNPAYIGKTRWSDEDHEAYRSNGYRPDIEAMPDGKHVPIIDPALWEAAQEKLAKRHTEPRYVRKGRPVYMLKGVVRCSSCGGTMVNMSKTGAKRERLQCCKYSRGQCTVSHFVYQDVLEAAVVDGIRAAAASGNFTFAPPESTHKPHLSQDWDKLIAAEKIRLKRAKEAYLSGAFDADEYAEVKTDVSAAIERLSEQAKKNETPEPEPKDYRRKVAEALSVLESPDMDGETKNRALRSIVDKIVYNKAAGTVDIFYRA